jgi:hypothetical protein
MRGGGGWIGGLGFGSEDLAAEWEKTRERGEQRREIVVLVVEDQSYGPMKEGAVLEDVMENCKKVFFASFYYH